MNLVIDCGNTNMKFGFFVGKQLISSGSTVDDLFENIYAYKNEGHVFKALIGGSNHVEDDVYDELENYCTFITEADNSMRFPIKIDYNSKNTLGFDRIANAVGAAFSFKERKMLIIDAGTAITYDYVDRDGAFLGGNIAPGYTMRLNALHNMTELLPLVSIDEAKKEDAFCGKDTRTAIANGVFSGVRFEVIGYTFYFLNKNPDGLVVVTGGDSDLVGDLIQRNVKIERNLGLIGMNTILNHNKFS
ncbi:MAG: type III pantothenate kinase [Culturomica sp.]|jgi:type III pantothenate kinase|nr:type III pantothenate kinase [Culturomica sp.]